MWDDVPFLFTSKLMGFMDVHPKRLDFRDFRPSPESSEPNGTPTPEELYDNFRNAVRVLGPLTMREPRVAAASFFFCVNPPIGN